MRACKIITIRADGADDRDVTVLEVSVDQLGDVLDVLAVLAPGSDQPDLMRLAGSLLSAKDGPARRLLHGMTDLGPAIDAVGGCALIDIVETWVEVNRAFFDRLIESVQNLGRSGAPAATAAPPTA